MENMREKINELVSLLREENIDNLDDFEYRWFRLLNGNTIDVAVESDRYRVYENGAPVKLDITEQEIEEITKVIFGGVNTLAFPKEELNTEALERLSLLFSREIVLTAIRKKYEEGYSYGTQYGTIYATDDGSFVRLDCRFLGDPFTISKEDLENNFRDNPVTDKRLFTHINGIVEQLIFEWTFIPRDDLQETNIKTIDTEKVEELIQLLALEKPKDLERFRNVGIRLLDSGALEVILGPHVYLVQAKNSDIKEDCVEEINDAISNYIYLLQMPKEQLNTEAFDILCERLTSNASILCPTRDGDEYKYYTEYGEIYTTLDGKFSKLYSDFLGVTFTITKEDLLKPDLGIDGRVYFLANSIVEQLIFEWTSTPREDSQL